MDNAFPTNPTVSENMTNAYGVGNAESAVNTDSLNARTIVQFLADIFQRRGQEEYLGEPVTMAEHMLQGAHFAEKAGESEAVVVAALLHDIGHFTSEFGTFSMQDTDDRFHEAAGAQVLEPFFPKLVIDCVHYHVAAKRYLCAVDKAYYDRLSTASIHSLNLQGGAMSTDEVARFEKQPDLQAIVSVRRYDDQGKVAGLKTPEFSHYVPAIERVVAAHLAATRL
jgi:phosphonate degradation associated HDIG domain protein